MNLISKSDFAPTKLVYDITQKYAALSTLLVSHARPFLRRALLTRDVRKRSGHVRLVNMPSNIV